MGSLLRRQAHLIGRFMRLPYYRGVCPASTGFFLTGIASTGGVCGCLMNGNVVIHGHADVSLYHSYLHIAVNAHPRGSVLLRTLGGCRY